MQFTVTHLTGSRGGAVQVLEGQVITIGRDPSNVLAFDPHRDDKVSGFHANLTVQGGQVVLTDLGSSNGTLVNGQRIHSPVPLVSGANVQFGEGGPIVSIAFSAAAGAVPPAGAAAAAGAAPAAGAVPPAPPPGGAPAGSGGPGVAGEQPAAPTAADAGSSSSPSPPKAPSKLRTCLLPAAAAVLLLGGVLLVSLFLFRGHLPSPIRNGLRRVPLVGPYFKKAEQVQRKVQRTKNTLKRVTPRSGEAETTEGDEGDGTGDGGEGEGE